MSESAAIVTRIDGEFALIEVEDRISACGRCGDKNHCGKPEAAVRRYTVRNTVAAQPGDRVLVSVPDGAVLKAAALSYLMPLLFLFCGAMLATQWIGTGLPAVAGAVFGLAIGVLVLRLLNMRFASGREPWLSLKLQRPIISIDKED